MPVRTACLALILAAAPLRADANVTSILPSGPVPDAAIVAAAVAPQPRANWFRSATPDVAVHVDTEQDRDRPAVLVSFTPRDLTAGHAVERAEAASGPWTEIGQLATGATETWDRRTDRARRYYYRVVAVRGVQRSLPSEVVEVDLPTILAALETKIPPGARKPLSRHNPDVYDSDGTAAFLVLLFLRSTLGRRRA